MMLLGLGIASEIVGAFGGVNARRISPIMTQMVSAERAAALRNKCLNLTKTRLGSGSASERTSQSRQLMSPVVQVFGRRNAKIIHALWRPASEKRQGTKSRGVGRRRCSGRY